MLGQGQGAEGGSGGTPADTGGPGGSGGAGGSGGIAGTGGSGAGGTAGIGGSGGTTQTACSALVERETRTIATMPEYQMSFPKFVQTTGGPVTLAYRMDPLGVDGSWTKLAHVSFDAWGSWDGQQSLGQGWLGCAFAGESFALGPDRDGGFAFLVSTDDPASPEPGLYLGRGHPAGFNSDTELHSAQPAQPLAVSHDGVSLLLAYARDYGGEFRLSLSGQAGMASVVFPTLGCASMPLQADAIPFDGGFLLAVSTSKDPGYCDFAELPVGPPDRIQILRVWTTGDTGFEVVVEIPSDGYVERMRLVPRGNEGAWLAWQTVTEVNPSAIRAVRLNAKGELYSKWNDLPTDGYFMLPEAVTNLGERLATAVIDAYDPSIPQILVQLHDDEDGPVALSHVVSPPADQWPVGPIALLGSPQANSLLLAWTGVDMSGGMQPNHIYVRRLDCVE